MTHITEKQCSEYVNDMMPDSERRIFENHIYSCDECLSMYTSVLEGNMYSLPSIEDPVEFTENTLQLLKNEDFSPRERKVIKPKQWYEKPIGYYAIAAGITVLLLSTGVFDQIVQLPAMTKTERGVSLSDSLMNKTLSMIDTLEPNQKEGK